jgi:molybdopterin-guanine dinucleotide biosynthesis adapter protein
MHTHIPVVAIVGRSGSGKTTMIEKLIPELKRRSYRVGTIKHHAHPDFEIDYEGKDSWRHMQAGSDHVILAAPNKIASIRRLEQPLTVENIVNTIMTDTDLVITDGYRGSSLPKLEIVRRARSLEPVCSPQELLGIITDHELENFNITHFALDDIVGIAEFIEEKVIRSHQPPEPSAG